MEKFEAVLEVTKKLYEKKALDISGLSVGHLTVLCDYMVIASARTTAQVSSLVAEVDEVMAQNGFVLRRSEGQNEGMWAILDYGFMLVHIFHRDQRSYYSLERLWSDGNNKIDLGLDQTLED